MSRPKKTQRPARPPEPAPPGNQFAQTREEQVELYEQLAGRYRQLLGDYDALRHERKDIEAHIMSLRLRRVRLVELVEVAEARWKQLHAERENRKKRFQEEESEASEEEDVREFARRIFAEGGLE
jgi:chromosome segregation ATPase